MRRFFLVLGGFAIVAGSFFATLFVIDNYGAADAYQAKTLMSALEEYRAAKGSYPVLADVPVSELKPLIDGKFLKTIPANAGFAPSRYVSGDGKSYGLLIFMDAPSKDRCLIEVRASKTGWWGQPAACKF